VQVVPEQQGCPAATPHVWHVPEKQVVPLAVQVVLPQQGWLRLPQGGGVAHVPDWHVKPMSHVVPLQQICPVAPQGGGSSAHVPDSQMLPELQESPGWQQGCPTAPQGMT